MEWDHGSAALAWDHLQQCQWNLHGWEHRYLVTQFNKNALKGHTDHVTSVAVSPDGKRIVSGSRDGTLKVWDAADLAVPGAGGAAGPARRGPRVVVCDES